MQYLEAYHLSSEMTQADRDERNRMDCTCFACGFVEQVVQASMARGKTREQAESFLNILGSSFRRNGWAPGEPMTDAQIDKKLSTFLGTTDGEQS